MIIQFLSNGDYVYPCEVGYNDFDVEVDVEVQPEWEGKLELLRYEGGEVVFHPNLNYAIDREESYPSIGDQLDALFHAGAFTSDMTAQIQAIKDAFPKPL